MIVYVTGGARSGKSQLAEDKVSELGQTIAYIATAIPFDDGMKDRIKKHQTSRPSAWLTIEQYKAFQTLRNLPAYQEADALIFDCITVMITNLMIDTGEDFDRLKMDEVNAIEKQITDEVKTLLKTVKEDQKHLVIVSNEVGMGLVPAYKMGSYFRDFQGRINQLLAKEADEVYFAVSGLPMKLK